ncbi:MAG: radical SAM protein [Clostridiales bacterium]|nr:radical SAM protein [Clostridiales bacterium]
MKIVTNMSSYGKCTLCPRRCGVNRSGGQRGFCRMGDTPVVNLSCLHFGEEPIITGQGGSGTVFFEGCSLGCVFCQNNRISKGPTGNGTPMDEEALARQFLELESRGAENINLVTPMHFAPHIGPAVKIARSLGLTVPVAVNTGGYESVSSLKMLRGDIDIYMPDIKFFSGDLALECTGRSDYFEIAMESVREMVRQTGAPVIEDGLMRRGVIIRHMMMPGKLFDTKKILDRIYGEFGDDVYISLMFQYTPMPHVLQGDYPSYMKKKVQSGHCRAALDYLINLGVTNAFYQDEEASGYSMIPDFR